MKKDRTLSLLYFFSLLVFVVGAVWTAFTLSRAPVETRRLTDRQDALKALHALERERNRQQGAILAFEDLEDESPASLVELAATHLSGVVIEMRTRTTVELPNGWNVRRVELVSADAPLEKVAAFLTACESGRPPWRLIDCEIAASRTDGGYGRVVLGLEALSRQTADAEPARGQ